ncbi:cytochrome d ubiquinol oxidase subunit II [Pantoea sp. Bo_2]|uniref:Cytochrome d ubiquinol oxidase subunit II n=1 Tax=Candidatus Pantoea gossypiicola TaxID=2608008 RepID=A0AB34CJA4_9GAMM|nr:MULTISPECIES: cytochrome d ubiquinol oxidase subunit II [Pantoea]KAA5932299.1 cytochrome d ubiquinol oxidase subunit II [Pantoea sp. VH_8]KAA5937360.1 cytochrome d ubiquinol oxidase subunit II [Pantoea sp. VH_4]KAA5947053.1 cytochrome d ubiquinol oxidase subunit II [Pantoea sp. VH_3]KAA5951463.1 cytochrome d ubiquinol oxidase subunit II [Pantoea sp. VH_24]KAA5952134.1 cytochrome d ubiquinol oxidase subunit II [Pantoea sp. VH_25]
MADLSALIICLSLLLYLLLDGTDLGVGMLFCWFHAEEQRELMTQSILPVWDANETWLVLAAGGLLALFPPVYALLFSQLSVPLFAMLLALLVRAMALEYRARSSSQLRHWLDRIMAGSSALATFIQGWCAGMIISAQPQTGLPDGLSLVPLISGAGLMAINSLLACCWIGWRIGDRVQPLAAVQSWLWWLLALMIFLVECYLNADIWQQSWQRPPGKIAAAAIVTLWIALPLALWRARPLCQLILTLMLIGAVFTGLLCGLYPWLVPHQFSISESASSPVTQSFVLVGAAIAMPLTLLYHSWSFWVERRAK